MDRASRTDVREEQVASLEARDALQQGKAGLLAEFERRLRSHVDDRISGKVAAKTDFAKLETDKLTLIDTHAMDESVVTGNITRVIENLCHEELQLLNRGIGHLLEQARSRDRRNPFAPAAIVEAFSESLQTLKAEPRAKFTILKELNRASLSEINGIYADLNKHLQNLHVMPTGASRPLHDSPRRRTSRETGGGRRATTLPAAGGCRIGRNRRDGIVPPSLRRRCRAGTGAARGGACRGHRLPGHRRGRPTAASRSRRFRWTLPRATFRADRWRRRRRATSPGRRSWRRRCWARASRACNRARRISTWAAARSSSSPAFPKASTTSCATCSSRRSARRRISSNR